MQNERAKQVRAWKSAYKMSHGCIDCGYREHPVALDFDHVDGKTLHFNRMKSIRAVQEEIERHNCVVRCANCHRIKTYNTRPWEVGERYEPVQPDALF